MSQALSGQAADPRRGPADGGELRQAAEPVQGRQLRQSPKRLSEQALRIWVECLPVICEALPNVRTVLAAKEDSVDGEERYRS
jgi:hypothetical protein